VKKGANVPDIGLTPVRQGYVLTLKNLHNESDKSSICFKPLHPPLTLRSHIVWKKYKVFPKAIEIFLEILNEEIKKKQ
jgi:hypothetical protein